VPKPCVFRKYLAAGLNDAPMARAESQIHSSSYVDLRGFGRDRRNPAFAGFRQAVHEVRSVPQRTPGGIPDVVRSFWQMIASNVFETGWKPPFDRASTISVKR
jgi:hypothetical protein